MAKKRAASLTPERRQEIAKKAVAVRWKNARKRAAEQAANRMTANLNAELDAAFREAVLCGEGGK